MEMGPLIAYSWRLRIHITDCSILFQLEDEIFAFTVDCTPPNKPTHAYTLVYVHETRSHDPAQNGVQVDKLFMIDHWPVRSSIGLEWP